VTHPKLATVKSGYGGRGYAIPGRTKPSEVTGKPLANVYPSVTTVLKAVNKPALLQWVADQTAAKAVVSLPYLMAMSEEVGYGGLRFFWSKTPELVGSEVRRYFDGVKDDAAELGTNIHGWVEADIDGLSPYPLPLGIETEEMIEAWREWFSWHEVISHRQEFTCVNDTLEIAGTADADWSIRCDHEGPCLGQEPGDFVRTLVDLKSSRHTWPEHGYQLAALASAEVIMREVLEGTEGALLAEKTERGKKVRSWWVEDAPPAWERYALLHIRPDDLDTKGNLIPRFCALEDRTADMDLHLEGFKGALSLTRVQYQLKERAKARGNETEDL
jgi:hypothetical protein